MLRKYTLITAFLIAFSMPFQARAQTMDIVMLIENILKELQGVYSEFKDLKSSLNIEKMSQFMSGEGLKNMVQNAVGNLVGNIFDQNSGSGGAKESFLPLPEGLDEKADDPEAAADWMKKNLYLQKDNPTREERDEMSRKHNEFQYTTLMSAFAKAVSIRKKLDKTLETIDELNQNAENTESETELDNEINKIVVLKLEQEQLHQLIEATKLQVQGVFQLAPVDKQMSKALSGG